jgi:hypothetical protein
MMRMMMYELNESRSRVKRGMIRMNPEYKLETINQQEIGAQSKEDRIYPIERFQQVQ